MRQHGNQQETPTTRQANSLIERKVQTALNGMRAYLVNAGLPYCFWPFAGLCFAYNESWSTHNGTRKAPRKELLGGKEYHDLFATGQLVFFKPAPTITSEDTQHVKIDHTLRPGIFIDYYMNCRGEFTGQYLVCPLTDFGQELTLPSAKDVF